MEADSKSNWSHEQARAAATLFNEIATHLAVARDLAQQHLTGGDEGIAAVERLVSLAGGVADTGARSLGAPCVLGSLEDWQVSPAAADAIATLTGANAQRREAGVAP